MPAIKSLACGVIAVYETKYVQTLENMQASVSWIDSQAPAGDFIQHTVETEGPEAYKRKHSSHKIRQYMKIYGSIHIHSCYKLTADVNNLHFMPG